VDGRELRLSALPSSAAACGQALREWALASSDGRKRAGAVGQAPAPRVASSA